ncbi:MAG TPA: hypothetical protein VGE98_16845 [Thermoanaerobaculia bacterium]
MRQKMWFLLLVLPITAGALFSRPAAAKFCGSGNFSISCTKTCQGNSTTTILHDFGGGSSCTAARSACSSCRPCPTGETQTNLSFGTCASAN